MTAQPLNVLRVPLLGVGLVEASAGTGKTFSITWLYLRLLLECGLSVRQILVVTFTEAAANELRDRIRKHLAWARTTLIDEPHSETEHDEVHRAQLVALVEQSRNAGRELKTIIDALTLALQSFDQAAIFTIHGWCRRILADYALEIGAPLTSIEIGDDKKVKKIIVEDIWRNELHTGVSEGAWLLRCFMTPADLLWSVDPLLNLSAQTFEPTNITQALSVARQRKKISIAHFISVWSPLAQAEVAALIADPRFGISQAITRGYHPEQIHVSWTALQAWLTANCFDAPLPVELQKFHPQLFQSSQTSTAIKNGAPLPEHDLLQALQSLAMDEVDCERLERARLLEKTILHTQAELRRREIASGVLGYDALIDLVYTALVGSNNSNLSTQLRARYPAALVDEFQDTDQRQFAIFRALYEKQSLLLMIGDAKQAIYRFRGGDVFAYGKARLLAKNNLYTLEANYRSEPALTQAVNQLFSQQNIFVYDFINCPDVLGCGPKNGAWLTPSSAPLVIWQARAVAETIHNARSDSTLAASKLSGAIAVAIVGEIGRLLSSATGLQLADRPLRASDIAVLVNTHDQARLIEHALHKHGFPCVRLSRDSVYSTVEAQEFATILQALLQPNRSSRVRAALATEALGWSANQIASWTSELDRQRQTIEWFLELATTWRKHGPLALTNELLLQVAPRLLLRPDGERRVGNWRHLGELLDGFWRARQVSEDQLFELERKLNDPDGESDAEQVRCANDADAVQIVTIHASKGLEYPIVFAPFLWESSRKPAKRPPVSCHTQDLSIVVDLGSTHFHEHAMAAEREDYAESVRRAYVACTRAINRLYLVWGKIAGAERSPLARLLHGSHQNGEITNDYYVQMDYAAIDAKLHEIAASSDGSISVQDLPTEYTEYPFPEEDVANLAAQNFSGDLSKVRSVYSFTRLAQSAPYVTPAEITVAPEQAEHEIQTEDFIASQATDTLLRGAKLGECLHSILQNIDFQEVDQLKIRALIIRNIERYSLTMGVLAPLTRWVSATLHAELAPNFRLTDLPPHQRVTEMEFHFALKSTSGNLFKKLAQQFPVYADALNLLATTPNDLQGWMHGYIDLVAEQAGRYFILDYKSNYLGPTAAAYTAERLAGAVVAHRYDLQALIYQLALHRYLGARLGVAYQPESALGEALYIFVRGVVEGIVGSGVYGMHPPLELIQNLDRCFSTAEHVQ